MDDPATVRLNIARYRCLLRAPIDAYMRRALMEILLEEETKLARQATEDATVA